MWRTTLNGIGSVMRFAESLINHVSRAFWIYSGVAVTLMAFAVTYGVATRYLFRHADPYSYVVTCTFMVSAVFLSIAHIEKLNEHLKVNLLSRYLPEVVRSILINVVAPILGIVCISVLAWKSWELASVALQTGDTFGSGVARVPTWPVRMTIPLGAGLLCLVLIAKLVRFIVTLVRKEPENGTEA